MSVENEALTLKKRFRGYFPVVIDVETAGFNSETDALLEICAVTLKMDDEGNLHPASTIHFHVEPFEGANLEKEALEFNGIRDPFSPLRGAVSEMEALKEIYKLVRKEQKAADCSRAIMVAHNANFDHSFVMAASERCKLKRVPFHPFATFDTATLSGLAYGQTVLAKACKVAGWILTIRKHTQHSMILKKLLSCSVASSTSGKHLVDGHSLKNKTNTTRE
ncbi:ribonuclease T [Vibrio astriarenae]|nr:ribonuclease T [Vibrio sp. C7]